MHDILIVDDEQISIDALKHGINWAECGIENIYSANNATEAFEIVNKTKIDIVICDIEMPGMNGLELMEALKKQYPNMQFVFLTGYAEFEYAQRAIQLGSCDYLVKPVDYEELKNAVTQLINKVADNEINDFFKANYNKYYDMWVEHLPAMREQFWQNAVSGRISPNHSNIKSLADRCSIPFDSEDEFVLIVIGMVEAEISDDIYVDDVVSYGLRNIATEMFFEEFDGVVIQDYEDNNVVIIYKDEHFDYEKLKNRCDDFIKACVGALNCRMRCYMSEVIKAQLIYKTYKQLISMDDENIEFDDHLLLQSRAEQTQKDVVRPPDFLEWTYLLEFGRKEELLSEIDQYINSFDGKAFPEEASEMLSASISIMVHQVIYKKGYSIVQIYGQKKLPKLPPLAHSAHAVKAWCENVITVFCDYLQSNMSADAESIKIVKQYINDNLDKEFSRADLAKLVYLNESYLSRLFKKDTGMSLSQYILLQRIELAKKLLLETEDKISSISQKVGYPSFSYFAKIFKKATGKTPQEYRG